MSGVAVNLVLILLATSDFVLLGSSRLYHYIRLTALQGVLLAALPILTAEGSPVGGHVVFLSAGTIVLKVIVFPWVLRAAIRRAGIRREIEPFVGYVPSLLFGFALLALAMWVGASMPVTPLDTANLGFATVVLTIGTGLFLIVSRKKAVTQVLGYLVLENGIFTFGVLYALSQPVVVELGVMLDIFVAIFLMGIMVFHIAHDFDHIDVDRLSQLHDLDPAPSAADEAGR